MDWKLELVPIPVADVDRAKAFYSEQVGFTVDHDTQAGPDLRVVQLTPPGSGCSIVIGAGTDRPPGSVQGVQLVVDDIDRARQHLLDRGVDASTVQHFGPNGLEEGKGDPWNAFVFFSDPDGNGWTLQERPAGE
jgi:catechol 2,3-dioxygenase-like lactoylglutathione lyase family enzyme